MKSRYTFLFLMLWGSLAFAQRPTQRKPTHVDGDSTKGQRSRGFSKAHQAFFENLSPEERKKIEAMPVDERRKYLQSKGLGRPRGN